MKQILSILVLLSFSIMAYAGSDDTAVKPFTIGVGTYSSVIAYDNALIGDDELSGLSLSFGYAISDQFAVRGTYFSLEHDDFSDVKSKGYDVLAHFGTGLATHGFKAYIGAGFFSDKWQSSFSNETFSGLQLSGGLGYNWDSVALEFILGLRDASDYEDFVNKNSLFNDVTAAAITGSLLLSYRF